MALRRSGGCDMKASGRALKPHPRNSMFELSGGRSRLACNTSPAATLSRKVGKVNISTHTRWWGKGGQPSRLHV